MAAPAAAPAVAPAAAAKVAAAKVTYIHDIHGCCAFKPDSDCWPACALTGDREDVISDGTRHYLALCRVTDGCAKEYTTLKWLTEDELIDAFKLNSAEHDLTLLNAVMRFNFEFVTGLIVQMLRASSDTFGLPLVQLRSERPLPQVPGNLAKQQGLIP